MNAIWTAIVLAAVGVALCLWLILRASWYSFFVFMLVAQPLLLIAALIFAGAVARELRRKGVLLAVVAISGGVEDRRDRTARPKGPGVRRSLRGSGEEARKGSL